MNDNVRVPSRPMPLGDDTGAAAAQAPGGHALHAPLHAICGFAQLIQRGAGSGDPRDHAAQILRAARHLLFLLADAQQRTRDDASAPGAARPSGQKGLPAPTSVTLAGRVLCIDLEPLSALLLRHFCAGFPGLALHCASAGVDVAEALQAVRTWAPELIVLDLARPASLALLVPLRTDPATAALPVVALGADSAPQRRADALAAGFDDCWMQPLDFDLIERRLASWLGGRPG